MDVESGFPMPEHSATTNPVWAQRRMIERLGQAMARQGHVRLIETHISWVLLCPPFAYKFKKPLSLPFLDYSTLPARLFNCEEELRLNRRLAPDLYLGLVQVSGSDESPAIGEPGSGPALDYALKMRAFTEDALWEQRIAHLLTSDDMVQLAALLSRFHSEAPRAPPSAPWAEPDAIASRTAADLAQVRALLAPAQHHEIESLADWLIEQHGVLHKTFSHRKTCGMVRECHGDLHCGNIVTIDGKVRVIDGIEFDPALCWIDVMHDVAFVWMDLHYHGRPDFAARLLNNYLQQGGDYTGLAVLLYYAAQRALVRCKVLLLRATQLRANADPVRAACAEAAAQAYRALAARARRPCAAALIITHGFSGSGKSTLCDRLVEPLGALQIRSDLERKRMACARRFELDRHAAAPPALYAARRSTATYLRLLQLARLAIAAGQSILVDAAFLHRWQRRAFRQLAQRLGVPFLIMDVHAPEALLTLRVSVRAAAGNDPSDADQAVLLQQKRAHEPLGADEQAWVLAVDNSADIDNRRSVILCRAVRQALAGGANEGNTDAD